MDKLINSEKRLSSNKGVTLIALVITIIVLLVLVTITVTSGLGGIGETKSDKLVTELGIVQNAALQQYYKYTLTRNDNDLVGEEVTGAELDSIANEMGITLTEINWTGLETKYYRLTPENLKEIGIKQSKDTYIINYETGEVINDTQRITDTGEKLYISGIGK